jgi:transcriptional regulator with XRE-family HTH domain
MVSGTIGERIAAYRRRRGLSQTALAALVGRSESWLSQVERGVRSVDRLSVLADMARVLHVDVESLTGQAWRRASRADATPADLNGIRRYFAKYDHLLGLEAEPTMDSVALGEYAARSHKAYQAAEYDQLGAMLPALLSAADAVRRAELGQKREQVLQAYFASFLVAAKLLTKMGVEDLALLAADRCANAASEIRSVEVRGIAAYQVACALLSARRQDEAEDLAVGMANRLAKDLSSGSPGLLSVAGSLWLISAVIAARRVDRAEASSRLAAAGELAALLGHDANYGWTAFGPTNVAIHHVSVAAELGDAGEALHAAESVNLDALPIGLTSRRAQVLLDLAWAQSQRKRDADAVLHLLEAEREAPAAVRYNAVVREMVREMVGRERRSKNAALHGLAVRSGVID